VSAPNCDEEFVFEGGEGLIEVRKGGLDGGLRVGGLPAVLYWDDCAGSKRREQRWSGAGR
jgi:hypothetical protein